jgi:excinuclease ABC subunit C
MTATPNETASKPTPFDSASFLKTVTEKAGVYVMLNVAGEVLYVGKAKKLAQALEQLFSGQWINHKNHGLGGAHSRD